MCRQNATALHLTLPFNYTYSVKSAKTNRESGEQYKDLKQDTWLQTKVVILCKMDLFSLFCIIPQRNANEDISLEEYKISLINLICLFVCVWFLLLLIGFFSFLRRTDAVFCSLTSIVDVVTSLDNWSHVALLMKPN